MKDSSQYSATQQVSETFKPTAPDWESHLEAWAYLQSLTPKYESKYLVKKSEEHERKGYLLGRRSDCDICFDQEKISKKHCLIYMVYNIKSAIAYLTILLKETGANAKAKGIRIFIQDLSSNGTYVNKELVGTNQRRLLRSGDIIQLIMYEHLKDNDIRHTFYRILFPSVYNANICQDDYDIQGFLGRGNFASVFCAKPKKDGKIVAIKIIDKSRLVGRPRLLKSVIDEIVVMMSMQRHPGIVGIDRIYNEHKQMFIVLEYVRDGDLFNFVTDKHKLTEDETRFIFWQLFKAIQWIHNNGIAHRDLKPENILLASREKLHVKISDFGLAKILPKGKGLDSQCGTPNYVAPEILRPTETRSYGVECDLWSLGVTLFICLCGYPPFSDEIGPSMKEQILQGMYSFQSPYWDDISPQAIALIRRLLTVDPMKRIKCGEILDHPWMKMNPQDMQRKRDALGSEVVGQIETLALDHYGVETQLIPKNA
ncbi:hypothetical protein G6F38_000947 [Rhizopus arrhizus]|nr:hypothetical protein G6F38_000947 [Rhizopus arrhizus]